LFDVELRKFEQLFLLTALRDRLADPVNREVNGEGHYDFVRVVRIPFAHFDNAQCEQVGVAFVKPLAVFEREGLVDAAVGNMEKIDVGRLVVAFNAENVDVVHCARHDFTACLERLYQHVAFFHCLCFLKAHFAGQLLHFGFHLAGHFGRVAFENFTAGGNVFQVFFLTLVSGAGAGAVVQVKIQAHLEAPFGYAFGSE